VGRRLGPVDCDEDAADGIGRLAHARLSSHVSPGAWRHNSRSHGGTERRDPD
jgi:hypothetical protein